MKNTLELMIDFCVETGKNYEKNSYIREDILFYEKKIGKNLLEMNEKEILDMFASFTNKNTEKNRHIISKIAINQYVSFYRLFFDWAIHKDLIKGGNIMDLDSLNEANVCKYLKNKYPDEYLRLADSEEFDDCIKKIRETEECPYLEMFARLLYEGVIHKIAESTKIKEKDVNLEIGTIVIDGKTFFISQELKNNLKIIKKNPMKTYINTVYERFDGSFIFYPQKVCKKSECQYIKTSESMIATRLRRKILRIDENFTPEYFYWSGFYNFLLSEYDDKEKIQEMLFAGKNGKKHKKIDRDLCNDLKKSAIKYNCKYEPKQIRQAISKFSM